MKKKLEPKKLSLNKKTIQFLTNRNMQYLNGAGTATCPTVETCLDCQSGPTTCVGLTPQTYCVGGTTVTISACNTGGGATGRC
jgi:hypothetical protein